MDIINFIKKSDLKAYFKNQPVNKAYLFGSHARGDDKQESDIDLLIELEDQVDLFQFISIKIHLEKLLGKKIDLISANGISPRIKPYIDKEKILIYEK